MAVRRGQRALAATFLALICTAGATGAKAQAFGAPGLLSNSVPSDSGDDHDQHVSTDGAGNWVAVWQSNDSLGGRIGTDWDILVARSHDDGATWSAPAALDAGAASDSASDRRPRVSTDGAGNWVAVWYVSRMGFVSGVPVVVDQDILVSRSTDNGATWSAPVILSNDTASDAGFDSSPDLSNDGAGNFVAVWHSFDEHGDTMGPDIGADADILVARSSDGGATWSAPAALNSNAAADSAQDLNPSVSTDGAGNWVCVWYSTDSLGSVAGSNAVILSARSTDDGATWSAPAQLAAHVRTDNGHSYHPRVTPDDAGIWLAVWESEDSLGGTIGADADILVSRSLDGGVTWNAAAVLNTNAAGDSGDDQTPQVTTDANGNWIAVWASSDTLGGTLDGTRNILVARSTDDGASWTAPAALDPNATAGSWFDVEPQLVTDESGLWIATWRSNDTLGNTIGTDFDILMSRSTDDGATWSAAGALNANAAADIGVDRNPWVGSDGDGRWIAVWQSADSLGDTVGTDDDILMSQSTDNGTSWTAPAALNTNAAGDSGADVNPQLCTDGLGNWVAVWESNDTLGGTVGTDSDILVARSTDGGVSWSAPAALNANAAIDSAADATPMVSTDGAGNWVAVWHSADTLGGTIGSDTDILVARSTDGGATWSPPAALNSNAAVDTHGDQRPQISNDGAGNWVVVWHSGDSLGGTIGLDEDLLVARSSDNGATWSAVAPLNANAVADAGHDVNPQLTTDRAGNWTAIWESYDDLNGTIGTDGDILVARSTDNGASWSAPAPVNANAASDSQHDIGPHLSTDAAGNWVAVWRTQAGLGGALGTDADLLLSRSTDGGASWSAPEALNANAAVDVGRDEDAHVASDGAGHWIAVWFSEDDLDGMASFGVGDIFYATATTICGDAAISSGEQCDDGDTVPGDGCDATCQVEDGYYCPTPGAACQPCSTCSATEYQSAACSTTADTTCTTCTTCAAGTYESSACGATSDAICSSCDASCATCDGDAADACLSCFNGYSLSGGACGDIDECAAMTHDCDANATCTNDAGSYTCACDEGFAGDGVSCAPVCSPTPLTCRGAQKSILSVVDKENGRDKLLWKWIRGEATLQAELADPTDSAHYSLCVYAGGAAALIAEGSVAPDATNWRAIGDKGYRYGDKQGAQSGLRRLVLKGGDPGRAKALVKGTGAELPEMAPPFALPVIVQLVNVETGVCFEGEYDNAAIVRNEAGRFTAKAQE